MTFQHPSVKTHVDTAPDIINSCDISLHRLSLHTSHEGGRKVGGKNGAFRHLTEFCKKTQYQVK